MKKIRKNYVVYILSVVIYSLIAIPSILAETGYVSDMLILSLKDGPGRQFNTIKTLRSNTPLEIIETTDRFLKVQTGEGDVGWVESQYITKELPKVLIIEQLNKRIAQLEGKNPDGETGQIQVAENQNYNKTNELTINKEAEYLNTIKSLEAALNTQLEKNRLLQAQLRNPKPEQTQTQSEQNLATHEQNNRDITMSNNTIQDANIDKEDIQERTIQKNSAENDDEEPSMFLKKNMVFLPDDDLLKTAMIKWFCAGAGVLIAGWFIGRSFAGGRRGRGGLLD